MNTNDKKITTNCVLNSNIRNKGFAILDETFKTHGWHLAKNDPNWISYTKNGEETTYFDIKIAIDRIIVSVPIKNSVYQYVTTFKSYFEASEYIEQRFYDYID
jgi:hypothetical protein